MRYKVPSSAMMNSICVGLIDECYVLDSLIVSGNRSTQCKVSSYLNGLVSAYHKKEIVQGPYRVFWPLPSNANKDRVSAEFV